VKCISRSLTLSLSHTLTYTTEESALKKRNAHLQGREGRWNPKSNSQSLLFVFEQKESEEWHPGPVSLSFLFFYPLCLFVFMSDQSHKQPLQPPSPMFFCALISHSLFSFRLSVKERTAQYQRWINNPFSDYTWRPFKSVLFDCTVQYNYMSVLTVRIVERLPSLPPSLSLAHR
jgi:hypothetical protein